MSVATVTRGALGAATAPDDLRELDRWVLWRYELGDKIPYRANGRRASSTNPRDWGEYETLIDLLAAHPEYDGLGFVFAKSDGLVGIDLDDCLDDHGRLKSWARGIVERLADTYIEVSPSGWGLKAWARGSLPANMGKVEVGDGGIEMYDHFRFFTVTGQVFNSAPPQVEDHAADVAALYDYLSARKQRRGRWQQQPEANGRIPFGQQHLTLVSMCGTLRRRGVCVEAIEACLQAVNKYQCERPGPPGNISRIVRSSRSWQLR